MNVYFVSCLLWIAGIPTGQATVDLWVYHPDNTELSISIKQAEKVRQWILQEKREAAVRIRPVVRLETLKKHLTTPNSYAYLWISPSRLPD